MSNEQIVKKSRFTVFTDHKNKAMLLDLEQLNDVIYMDNELTIFYGEGLEMYYEVTLETAIELMKVLKEQLENK